MLKKLNVWTIVGGLLMIASALFSFAKDIHDEDETDKKQTEKIIKAVNEHFANADNNAIEI